MRLICLNTWGGRVYGPLMDFVRKSDVDVFCFQEVFHSVEQTGCGKAARANLFSELEKVLGGYTSLYAAAERGMDYDGPVGFHLEFGQAMFVREGRFVGEHDKVVLYEKEGGCLHGEMPRVMQYARIGDVMVCNLHGLWNGGPKMDTTERLEQSRRIRDFLRGVEGKVVVCGDFNLLPDTKSLGMLEKEGLRNLIKEGGIKSTRSSFYSKKWPQFADYVLVSSDVDVKRFEVLQDQVSDHLPLFLEFD